MAGAAQKTSTSPAGLTALSPETNSWTVAMVVPFPALHFQFPPTTGTREAAFRVEEKARVAIFVNIVDGGGYFIFLQKVGH